MWLDYWLFWNVFQRLSLDGKTKIGSQSKKMVKKRVDVETWENEN